jgi:hypothetical protein
MPPATLSHARTAPRSRPALDRALTRVGSLRGRSGNCTGVSALTAHAASPPTARSAGSIARTTRLPRPHAVLLNTIVGSLGIALITAHRTGGIAPNAQPFAKPFDGRWAPSLLARREGGVRIRRRLAQMFGGVSVVRKAPTDKEKVERTCVTATTIQSRPGHGSSIRTRRCL